MATGLHPATPPPNRRLGVSCRAPASVVACGIAQAELLYWADQRLGKSQRLARIEFRHQLPKIDLGKTLKRQLRDAYWK
jgi:acyl-coenzyme A synthetase/AMP-(fatty) acid ligase